MSTQAENNLTPANPSGAPGAAPVHASAAAARPRRRRGLKFWLILAGIIVVLAPFAVFLAMLLYIRTGMLSASVADQISELFGVHAQVAGVTTHLLENLQISGLKVDSTHAGKPLTAAAIRLEWDYGPMLSSGRIRSICIERPALDLRRFSGGQWNFSLKTPQTTASNGEIEQLLIQHGDLAFTNETALITHLKDVNASFNAAPQPAPHTFTLRAKMESGEPFVLDGSLGPGENLVANASGSTVLDKDWPVLNGVNGKLSYELSCRRDVTAEQKTALPLKLSGRFDIEQFRWPVAPGVKLNLDNHNLQVQSALPPPDPPFQGGEKALLLLTGTKLTLDQLGTLELEKIAFGDNGCTVENGAAKIDLAGLKALIKLPAPQEDCALFGTLSASHITVSVPNGQIPPPHASADLSTPDTRIRIPGVGELPPLSAQAHVDWPAVTSAKIAMGSALNATLRIDDLRPDPWGANEAQWASVAAETTVQELSLDIGQLMQSDAGRRLLYGLSIQNRPIAPELPVSFEGMLTAKNVRPALTHGIDGKSGVTLSGLQIRELTVKRWPLPLRAPTLVMSGDVTAMLGCDRDFGPVALSGKIAEVLPKTLPAASALSGDFAIAFGPDEHGVWRPKPLKIGRLTVPWAALNRIVNLTDLFGVNVDGNITISDAVFDTNSGDLSAHVQVTAPVLTFPIPEQVQPMMANALRAAHYTISATVLEAIPITTAKLTNLSADFDVKIVNGFLTVSGTTHRGTLRVKPPYVPEVSLYSLPDLQFSYAQPLASSDGGRSYALKLNWLKSNNLKLNVQCSNGDVWKLQGDFQSQATGGKAVAFAATCEPQKALIGPLSISMSSLDAAELNTISAAISPHREAIPTPAYGSIQNVKFEMQPLSLRGSPFNKTLNARITGKFAGFGAKINEWDRVDLSGPLVCILSFANGTLGINTLVTLENYGALLGGGRIVIPPPPAGRTGTLKLAGKLSRLPDNAGTQFQIENFDLNLAGQVLASADGVIASDGIEAVSEIRLEHFRVAFPDLKDSGRAYLQANLELAGSRLDELNLSGAAALSGEYFWNESGRSRLLSALNLHRASATFSQPPAFALRDASGDVPLFLRTGTWRDADTLEQRASIVAAVFVAGQTRLENKKFEFIATPNALKLSEPVTVNLPGGALKLEQLDLETLAQLTAMPHTVEPKTAEAFVPNAKPSATIDLARETPATTQIQQRRAARAAKLNGWKSAGTLGEGSGGLLEVHLAPAAPLSELKLMRDTVVQENEDRTALFTALQHANGLPDAELPRVINAFARHQRESAAPDDWVRSPKDGKWVQRKALE